MFGTRCKSPQVSATLLRRARDFGFRSGRIGRAALLASLLALPAPAQDAEPELPPAEQAKEHYNRAQELRAEAASDPLKETEMIAEYTLCLKLDPNYVDAYTNLGAHYFTKKNFAEAEKNFKKAVELSPNDTTVY
ncbi:MAG: tetratricopeptide repeat protein, partial [Candidatus Zixiibacteriota bacterium]